MPLQKTLISIFSVVIPCSFTVSTYASDTKSEGSNSTQQAVVNNVSTTDSVINYGKLFMNRPYRFGSGGSDSFDCSGFTSFVYRNFGYALTHSSAAQANQFDTVKRSNLQKGDLVYFSGSRRSHRIGHVGIVTEVRDNGQFNFIHASNDRGITISSSEEPYYSCRFIKANRVIGGTQLAASNPNATEDFDDTFSPVDNNTNTQKVKRTTPAQYHKVKSGETLSDIANKYNLSIVELKKLNHLKSNKLNLKQRLKVKEEETYTEVVEIKQNVTENVATPATDQAAEATVTHKVKHGESLYSIAKQYGTTIENLKSLNKLEKKGIHSGQEIIIKQATTSTISETKNAIKTHKIESGESLYSISKLYNINIEDLKKANSIGNEGIRPGQILTIPVSASAPIATNTPNIQQPSSPTTSGIRSIQNQTREEAKAIKVPDFISEYNDKNSRILQHKVHPGENLATISRDFKVPVEELMALNNTQSTRLEVGQIIQIRVPIPTSTVKPSAKSNLPIVIGNSKYDASLLTENKEPSQPMINTPSSPREEKQNAMVAPTKEKTTISYKVSKHDNINSIARKYRMTADEIKQLNNLRNNHLRVGKYIQVYELHNDDVSTSKMVSEQPERTTDSYTVKKGDNLDQIAKHFNLTSAYLKQLNGLKDNKVHVGQTLFVNASAKPTQYSTNSPTKSIKETTIPYTVKKGDNLELIARKNNISTEQLIALNELQSNKITIGQQLKVYSTAETSDSPAQTAYKTLNSSEYTVKKGDNLDLIARNLNTTKDKIKKINGLKSDKIQAGQTIKITEETNNSPLTKAETNTKPSTTTYKVKKGDTTDGIAKKFNITPEELKENNKLKSNKIQIGQELLINTNQSSADIKTATKSETKKGENYEVKKGESLYTIARDHHISVEELKELNNLKDADIRPGKTLIISGSKNENKKDNSKTTKYIVKGGDSYYTIAHKFNCSIDDIKGWNKTSGNKIKPGDELIIKE